MRINQSGVLPTQPSNPHIRENSPRMLLRSPLGLSRSLSTDPPPPFSLLSTRIRSLEDRGACHLSPAGKKYASSPVPKLVG